MKDRKSINCSGDIKINTCNLKKNDVIVLTIPAGYGTMNEYENFGVEAEKLSKSLEKDLGFKIPVVVLAGDVSFKTIDKNVILDIIND